MTAQLDVRRPSSEGTLDERIDWLPAFTSSLEEILGSASGLSGTLLY